MSAPVVKIEIETLAGEAVARLQRSNFVPRRDVVLAAAAELRVESVRVWLEEEDPEHCYSASGVVVVCVLPYFTSAINALLALGKREFVVPPVESFSDDKGRLYFPHAVGTLFKYVESHTPMTCYFVQHMGAQVIRSVRVDVPFSFCINSVPAWRSREGAGGMHEVCFPHGFPIIHTLFQGVTLHGARVCRRVEVVYEFLNSPDRCRLGASKFNMQSHDGRHLKCSGGFICY